MKIVIIGTGNVAHVFGKLLASGHRVLQVFGRDPVHAKQLGDELNSSHCSTWSEISKEAEVYIVALSDKALYNLDQQLPDLQGKTVVHTAGSVSMEVLSRISPDFGIIYPLQSLKKGIPVLTSIPLLVNASNEKTSEIVLAIARSISPDVTVTTDKQRLEYHVAAVFINNFTNHLYAVAESFCRNEGIEFSLLLPLAAETAQRLETVSPAEAITGPAIRNDLVTIHKHLELLGKYPLLQNLYSHLTASIQQLSTPVLETKSPAD